MIQVYHNENFLNRSFDLTGIEGDPLHLAATVESDDFDKAYELTNNIEHAWPENEGVTCHTDKSRSTSIGDVLEKDGKFHVVAMCGFEEISKPGSIA